MSQIILVRQGLAQIVEYQVGSFPFRSKPCGYLAVAVCRSIMGVDRDDELDEGTGASPADTMHSVDEGISQPSRPPDVLLDCCFVAKRISLNYHSCRPSNVVHEIKISFAPFISLKLKKKARKIQPFMRWIVRANQRVPLCCCWCVDGHWNSMAFFFFYFLAFNVDALGGFPSRFPCCLSPISHCKCSKWFLFWFGCCCCCGSLQ